MTERLTAQEFQNRYGNPNHASPKLPNSKPKEQTPALGGKHAGKASGTGRPHVRFRLCRVRLFDVDAKYASVKDLLDGLQIASAIPGDREDQITLEVIQQKVNHYNEEMTIIEIIYPYPTQTP